MDFRLTKESQSCWLALFCSLVLIVCLFIYLLAPHLFHYAPPASGRSSAAEQFVFRAPCGRVPSHPSRLGRISEALGFTRRRGVAVPINPLSLSRSPSHPASAVPVPLNRTSKPSQIAPWGSVWDTDLLSTFTFLNVSILFWQHAENSPRHSQYQ